LVEDENIPAHFIGSIVYIEKGIYHSTSVPQLLVIDGQQRLVTLSLLLAALGKAIEEAGIESNITRKKINNYYLFNTEEDGDYRYKIVLTRSDKETYIRLIEDRELPSPFSKRIVENYGFFAEEIRRSGINPLKIYDAVDRLIIVDISLTQGYDNPQLIFESLNSTGLDLSQADLIRNYILMGLESELQTRLYRDCWYPMEQNFNRKDSGNLFDRFMRDYLTIKNRGNIPKIGEVYEEFKRYDQHAGNPIVNIVEDVYKYSKHFSNLVFAQEDNEDIGQILGDINTLKVDVAYPFLLEIYDDYKTQVLTREELIAILKLVESYVFRRAICGIPPNSLNKTFATLYRSIDKEDYLRSLERAFIKMDSYRRFPGDDEFKQQFVSKDVYNFRLRNYLLRKLENHNKKEKVGIADYTIEHIMPQNENLSLDWQKDLGEDWKIVHSKYLHTIGNLTLTAYNSELSDRSFKEKRDVEGGFADSPIRLNRGLAKLEGWNEACIMERAETLANLAAEIWRVPDSSMLEDHIDVTEGEKRVYTLEDFSDQLQGERGELFHILRRRILNLDSSVKEDPKQTYIAYKTVTNFVDIVPQKKRLKLYLNMPFEDIYDPNGLCEDVTGLGHWGNGDVQINVNSINEIDNVMLLIQQSFDIHRDDADE
jgi:uncharacterized protein with ParB-like and HNH nuclease domain/predicted transport protein